MKSRSVRLLFLTFGISAWALVFNSTISAASLGTSEDTGFPNKRITWIVTYPPGGGYDTYSRVIAKTLRKYLPHEVDIVVKNIPGAGGRRGTAVLYRSKPDGYTIGLINPVGLISGGLVKAASNYDLDKFTLLATCSQSIASIWVRPDSKFNSLESMQEAERIRFATSGRGSSSWLWAVMTREVFDIPVHFVSGYLGTTEYFTALLRKDVDAVASGFNSSLFPYLETGEVKLLMVFLKDPWELLPLVPTLRGTPHEELEFINSDRVIAAPPGVKDNIARILRDSLQKALHDPELHSWAQKSRNPLLIRNAGETKKRIEEIKRLVKKYEGALRQ
jgi:tripartite-type tricarboxylate transporter receptor subunit TctC